MLGDTDSIASDIAPLPNPPVYMPYSGTYNTSHGYQPIQYGCTDRHISSGEFIKIYFTPPFNDIVLAVHSF